MTNYGERTGAGSVGTAIITNDDAYLLDIPDEVDDSDKDYSKVKDEMSF